MKKSPWLVVSKVVNMSDIVLYLIDSRFPEEGRNRAVEQMLRKKRKRFIAVFTKYDIADEKDFPIDRSLGAFALVSAKNYYGIQKLREKIIIEGKRMGIERPRVGVIGYPNVGKSSIINALRGKASARTSSQPGFTKGCQYIATEHFLLIDTPGVIPRGEKDELKQIRLSVKNYNTKNFEENVERLIAENPGAVEKFFSVPVSQDIMETLGKIAAKKGLLKRGGEPDMERAARMVLKLYQDGKIKQAHPLQTEKCA
jgi:ribosome biogenesis GTPase A